MAEDKERKQSNRAAAPGSAYFLTWNPKSQFPWDDCDWYIRQTKLGKRPSYVWSSGNRKTIMAGDRLFLVRQGDHRGLVGSGTAISGVYRGKKSQRRLLVKLTFDTVLTSDDVLPIADLEAAELGVHWNSMLGSGVQVPPPSVDKLERMWHQHLIRVGREAPRGLDEVPAVAIPDEDEEAFPEGREMYRLHRLRERNRVLVEKVKSQAEKAGKLRCAACDFDFLEVYGELGKGFIECHHTVPISEYKKNQKTRIAELALVCSNCHRMLHRRRPWLTIKHLSRLIDDAK